jgi:cyclophilin family peptidyl-prolyl cis-trans isomerase
MKKILILLLFIFVLSGCTSNAEQVKGVSVKEQAEEAPVKEQNISNQMSIRKQRTLADQIDLAAEYSQAIIKTNLGDIKVKFYTKDSPVTVNNFLNLSKSGFYDDTKFHRVIKDFMIQGGDPNSKDNDWSNDGTGGPDYRFADEFNSHKLVKGSLAMANSGADSNGSQFFIVTAAATPWLNGKHTNFGEVIEGMDVVEKIEAAKVNQNDHPLDDVAIKNIELEK